MFKFDMDNVMEGILLVTLTVGAAFVLLLLGTSFDGKDSRKEVSTTSFESKVNSLALEACGKAAEGQKVAQFHVWGIHAEAVMTWDESGKLLSCELRD